MRLERLFHVLVLGGAAIGLTTGCDDGTGGAGEGGSGGSGGAAGGGTATTSTTTGEGAGGSGGATASATETGSGGATTTGETTGSGGSGRGLECSEPADPGDPCGCPCCWAENCSNDDPACCGAFCEGTCC